MLASTACAEAQAVNENFAIVSGGFTGIDIHAKNLNHATADCQMIVGGKVCGGSNTGELINVRGFFIQNRVTVRTLLTECVKDKFDTILKSSANKSVSRTNLLYENFQAVLV